MPDVIMPETHTESHAAVVVVIDDNPDLLSSMEMVLELSGHHVTGALDGMAGIEAVRRVRPEVVICDIGLPGGMDGFAVARALRADPALCPESGALYLIALSGYSQEEDRRRSGEAGFNAHLAKPPDLDMLSALIAGACRR